jgi:ABC-type branched-subunit amino acid transport system ATPase component/ABC-type branched-subunit amino acid transport system permease subunit
MVSVLGLQMSSQSLLIGATTGLAYGVLALGIVLIYRTTGVVNFAQAEIGAFAATVQVILVGNYGFDFWLALPLSIVTGAALAGVVELVVVRRLFDAPRVTLFIATVGVAQLIFFAGTLLPDTELVGAYPTVFEGDVNIVGVKIPSAFSIGSGVFVQSRVFSLVVLLVPIVAGLAWLMTRTRLGLAVRASGDSPETARSVGISPRRTSTAVWIIAGAFAAVTGVLTAPFSAGIVGASLEPVGPGLLLRALAAALIARLTSLPMAIVGGIVVGVTEAVVLRNLTEPGVTELVLFGFVTVGVLAMSRRARAARDEPPARTSVHRSLTPTARSVSRIGIALAVIAAIVLPIADSRPSQLLLWSTVALFAVVAISCTILVGWAGQLSLGQFAFTGVGALVTVWSIDELGIGFLASVLVGVVAGAVTAAVVGLPALRARGLLLAVMTLAFAGAASAWLFELDFWTDGATAVSPLGRPDFGVVDLVDPTAYYYTCLVVLLGVAVAVSRLRRTGAGRDMVAVRDNERMAAACTVSPSRTKVAAFALAGGIAALAGGLYAGLLPGFAPAVEFGPEQSIRILAIGVIGGLGSVGGAVLGALWVLGIPALVGDTEQVRLLTSGVGLLVLLLYFPDGLAGVAHAARDGVAGLIDRRRAAGRTVAGARGRAPEALHTVATPPASAAPVAPVVESATSDALVVANLTVRYGGHVAVDDASLAVAPAEIVGLIGPNGAGKTTLMHAISGFVPSRGRVEVFGRDLSRSSPAQRHRHGLARSFQDARLFAGLTVREHVLVALESRGRTPMLPSLLAIPPTPRIEGERAACADEILELVGMGQHAERLASELSTGMRRILELACLLAMRSRMILLDEPTAGLAQRESEAFAPLLVRVRAELGAALLVIEHDMPFVFGMSDRVYCLAAGSVIAEGTPERVRSDPAVVASYLGRSDDGIVPTAGPDRDAAGGTAAPAHEHTSVTGGVP